MYLEDEELKIKQDRRKNKCVTFNKPYAVILAMLLCALFLPQLTSAREASGYGKSNWYCSNCSYENSGRFSTCSICGNDRNSRR